jgi:hypothetical protein
MQQFARFGGSLRTLACHTVGYIPAYTQQHQIRNNTCPLDPKPPLTLRSRVCAFVLLNFFSRQCLAWSGAAAVCGSFGGVEVSGVVARSIKAGCTDRIAVLARSSSTSAKLQCDVCIRLMATLAGMI